ncbi:MAG: hypothetical protein E7590_03465 [Ruminococcaceae bacterium]|nr:hypothetical protein [Oscillospiraceae bacterium]
MKVLIQLFQKLARVWGAEPHKTAFLFVSFFFAPCAIKEKATKVFLLSLHKDKHPRKTIHLSLPKTFAQKTKDGKF